MNSAVRSNAATLRPNLGHGARYLEVAPLYSLAADIEYCWALSSNEPLASPITTRSPGKDSVDLIVPISGHFCQRAERHLFGAGRIGSYLVGPLSQPADIISSGLCTVLGVRFRAGRSRPFFRFATHEIMDICLPVHDMNQGFTRVLADRVVSQNAHTAMLVLQQALLEVRSDAVEATAVTRALGMIEEHHGRLSIDAIADRMHPSVRNLERLFHEAVGLSPKQVSRIARVRRAVGMLFGKGMRAVDVVHACGYFDQAHFIREFKAVVGVAPSAFLKERERPCSSV